MSSGPSSGAASSEPARRPQGGERSRSRRVCAALASSRGRRAVGARASASSRCPRGVGDIPAEVEQQEKRALAEPSAKPKFMAPIGMIPARQLQREDQQGHRALEKDLQALLIGARPPGVFGRRRLREEQQPRRMWAQDVWQQQPQQQRRRHRPRPPATPPPWRLMPIGTRPPTTQKKCALAEPKSMAPIGIVPARHLRRADQQGQRTLEKELQVQELQVQELRPRPPATPPPWWVMPIGTRPPGVFGRRQSHR